jgi:hypothetical protein
LGIAVDTSQVRLADRDLDRIGSTASRTAQQFSQAEQQFTQLNAISARMAQQPKLNFLKEVSKW